MPENEKLTRDQRISWVIGTVQDVKYYDQQDVESLNEALRKLENACGTHTDPDLSDWEKLCLSEAIDFATFWNILSSEEKEGLKKVKQEKEIENKHARECPNIDTTTESSPENEY